MWESYLIRHYVKCLNDIVAKVSTVEMCKQAYCAYKWEFLTIFFLNLRSVKPSWFYMVLPNTPGDR